jgi:hypothetical protein
MCICQETRSNSSPPPQWKQEDGARVGKSAKVATNGNERSRLKRISDNQAINVGEAVDPTRDGQLAFECGPVQHVFSYLNDSSRSIRRKDIIKFACTSVEVWEDVNERHEWLSLEPPATAANCLWCV